MYLDENAAGGPGGWIPSGWAPFDRWGHLQPAPPPRVDAAVTEPEPPPTPRPRSGFDPLGLAKPVEYLQVDVDELDQNAAVNRKGEVVGSFQPVVDQVDAGSLQPYSEVFGIGRFRETELIHGRWAMLATLGVLVAEYNTGVAWQDAGKVELDGLTYFGFDLPFTLTQVVWAEVILVGGAEFYRNTELDTEKRCYPGGPFDPLNLAGGDPAKAFKLKEAELKHGRLAMVSFFGYGVQALYTGNGAFESLAKIADEF